jgi:hypothetical protein
MGEISVHKAEYSQTSVPRRTLFRVIDGLHNNDTFHAAQEYIEKQASRFWGIEGDTPVFQQRQDDEYYLDKLQFAMQRLPDLNPEQTKGWRHKYRTAYKVGQICLGEVRLPSRYDPRIISGEDPLTYADIMDNPVIGIRAIRYLSERGDQALLVVQGFERWRLQHQVTEKTEQQTLSSREIERGFRVIEEFLFALGGIGALGYAEQEAKKNGHRALQEKIFSNRKIGRAFPFILKQLAIEYIDEQSEKSRTAIR